MRCRYFATFLILLTFLGPLACQKAAKPQPPKAEGFDPPIQPTLSYLAGPLTLPLSQLEKKINKALKPVLVPEDAFRGKRGEKWRLRIERSGPVRIRYARKQVFFSAPVRVFISNPIRLFAKKVRNRPVDRTKLTTDRDPFCELQVNFASPLEVNSNWRLSTRVRFADYKWIEEPKIKFLGINIPVTGLADSILKKRRHFIEHAIDSVVHTSLRLDKLIQPIWRDLHKPILISRPYGLWLLPKPISIAAGPLQGSADAITVPLRIAFETATHVGDRPDPSPLGKLPRLLERENVSQVSNIRVLTFVPYERLNRILDSTLERRKISLAGGMLQVKSATVYGGQRSLIVKTDVSGAVKGTLYFRAQPAFDTLTYTLRMKNLDFDVHTEEVLLSTADWLLHDRLRDTLQKVMHFPLREQINTLPNKIGRALEKGKVGKKTDIEIESFRFVPQQMAIRPDGIQALIKIESNLNVAVTKL